MGGGFILRFLFFIVGFCVEVSVLRGEAGVAFGFVRRRVLGFYICVNRGRCFGLWGRGGWLV